MRPFILLALCAALSAQNAGTVYVMGGFMKGSEYLEADARFRAAYAAGFVNGMSVAAVVLRPAGQQVPLSTPKWLEDHEADDR